MRERERGSSFCHHTSRKRVYTHTHRDLVGVVLISKPVNVCDYQFDEYNKVKGIHTYKKMVWAGLQPTTIVCILPLTINGKATGLHFSTHNC